MKVWVLKAVIQKGISFLPFKHRVNYLFQKYVTKGVLLTDALFIDKLTHCRSHLTAFKNYHPQSPQCTSLEIGTGWYPIVPIGLYLAGGDKIYTIDISGLLTTGAIHNTINFYLNYNESGKLKEYLSADPARLEKLKSLLQKNDPPQQLLKELNIEAIVGDARHISLPDAYFDLINSNNTFEHIYPEILVDILKEFKRLLKPDGIMSHQIDLSDHFAHLDKSITIYNFLRFDDAEWGRIDNSIQPQNRMRINEYRQLYEQTGHKIVYENNVSTDKEGLKSVPLDKRFAGMSAEDVAVSHSLLVSKI